MNKVDRAIFRESSDSTAQSSCGIAVMAKASTPGRTKTRLVPPLNFEEAAAFNTAFLCDVTDNLLRAGTKAEITPYVAFGPPGSGRFFRDTLSERVGLIDAWLPNFGACLLLTIEEIFRRGHSSAVVLNSDSPTLPTQLLVDTANLLAQPGERAVLGPSSDGGYYLLGLKSVHSHMFENIAWSTERVAEQTLARAREIDLDVHALPAWYDVDDAETLRRLHAELFGPRPVRSSLVPYRAPHTAALIAELGQRTNFIERIGQRVQLEELRA
jgi:rSAM/selenodomain-associated transferase 1